MFKLFRNTIQLKHNDNDSSYDSNRSDLVENNLNKSNHQETEQSSNLNFKHSLLTKEKLKTKNKEITNIFDKKKETNWKNFYKTFFDKSLSRDTYNIKEVELRINSVLNKYDESKNRIIMQGESKKSNNNLLNKNKYELKDKNKFVQMVLSKYNEFEMEQYFNKTDKLNKLKSRNKPKRKDRSTTINVNMTKSTNVDSHRSNNGVRRDTRTMSEVKKNVNFKEVLTKLTYKKQDSDWKSTFPNFSKQNSLKNEQDKAVHRPLKSEIQQESPRTALKFFEKLNNFNLENSFVERKSEKKKTIPLSITRLITNSKFMESAISTTLKKEDFQNIKHDIKSYEKELNRMNKIFTLPKNKPLNHFFAFDTIQEGINKAKKMKVRKFFFKEKLDSSKRNVDFVIENLLTV